MAQSILIIEDGDEYLRFFSRYLEHYAYRQARSLDDCLEALQQEPTDAFVLDLRFDRVPRASLTGDAEEMADRLFGGDLEAAWRYVVDNQGYLILRTLRDMGYDQPALLVAELPDQRQDNLRKLYGNLGVVPSFDPRRIAQRLGELLG